MRATSILIGLVLAAAVAAVSVAAPAASPPPLFVLTGGGWGHGVGMSQWGALGQAREGRTFEQILATYYPGTELERIAMSKVRVLLVAKATSVRVTSAAPVRVRGADGTTTLLPAGTAEVDRRLRLAVEGKRVPLVGPLRILPVAGAPLQLGDLLVRGELRVSLVGGLLQVVNVLGLEAYLQGVVPGEMPKDWPAAALQAQAVAARTYAVAGLLEGQDYDLYADYRSQVYGGVAVESPATTRAVKATRGLILSFEGEPAQTLYFSSSGGRTASALDVFGNDLPYLTGVDDPWDAVPENPNHRWEPRVLTGKQLAIQLRLASPVVDAAFVPGVEGSPATMRFTTKAGTVLEQRITELRARLGLRSSSFRVGVLRLLRPAGDAVSGAKVALTGVARDVEDPVLERRATDGSWARTARVVPRADGTFTVVVRPQATTTYRLSTAGLAGPSLTLTVTGAPE